MKNNNYRLAVTLFLVSMSLASSVFAGNGGVGTASESQTEVLSGTTKSFSDKIKACKVSFSTDDLGNILAIEGKGLYMYEKSVRLRSFFLKSALVIGSVASVVAVPFTGDYQMGDWTEMVSDTATAQPISTDIGERSGKLNMSVSQSEDITGMMDSQRPNFIKVDGKLVYDNSEDAELFRSRSNKIHQLRKEFGQDIAKVIVYGNLDKTRLAYTAYDINDKIVGVNLDFSDAKSKKASLYCGNF